jgi:hypothetical protein
MADFLGGKMEIKSKLERMLGVEDMSRGARPNVDASISAIGAI